MMRPTGMRLGCLLSVALLCVVAHSASYNAEDECELLQHSVEVVPSSIDAAKMGDVPSVQFDGSKEQVDGELKAAQQARHDVLVMLRRWDEHIADLEARLSSLPRAAKGETVPPQVQNRSERTDMVILQKGNVNANAREPTEDVAYPTEPGWETTLLCILVGLIALYAMGAVGRYEGGRNKWEPPWYYHGPSLTRLGASVGACWILCGMIVFTKFLLFAGDDGHRHLTLAESVYLSAQIVTTVGYGDLTPATDFGKVFVVIYVISGIVVIGALLQELISMSSAMAEQGRLLPSILSGVVCIAFGTLFYWVFPGEGKTFFEAFYMSVITLLTVGFGAYHPVTQVGCLIGAVWMIIGVACVGNCVATLSARLLQQRFFWMSKKACREFFHKIDKDNSGDIDRLEFITFEMIRIGVPEEVVQDAIAKFAEFDADGDGSLDIKEFEAYVHTI